MIKQITNDTELNLDLLENDCYSRKLKSNFYAYKTDYDFCRFYVAQYAEKTAIINIFNSSMLVAFIKGTTLIEDFTEDLVTFINMNKPSMIEMDRRMAVLIRDKISDEYYYENRTEFEKTVPFDKGTIEPDEDIRLDDVFHIVREAFPALADSYELWITDTSHRLRRNQSQLFSYKNSATLMVKYVVDGYALIGQVGTLPDERGKGYARKLLFHVCDSIIREGNKVCLFAREKMVSYYKMLGFVPVLEDIVFERKKDND